MPSRITTTLYDLLDVLQTVTEPHEDALVVALVTHWVGAGRLTWLPAVSTLPSCGAEEGIAMRGEVSPATCMVC